MRRYFFAAAAFVCAVALIVSLSALATSVGAASAESDRIPSPAGSSSRLAGEPRVQAQVLNDVRRAGYADVVVLLRDGLAPSSDLEAFETAADAVQDAVLSAVPSEQFEVHTKYDALPILAGRVTAAGLAALERHPLVAAVEADEVMKPIAYTHPGTSVSGRVDPGQALAEAVPVIEADYVHEHYGITGEGVTVAVLDTGIDNDHPDFADKILDQYCYASSRSCPPTDIVEGPSAEDEYGHGTAVSGIILSNGTVSHVGVAPGAKLAAVRVFKDSGGASTSDIIKGLDWVLRKQHPLGIRVVNMSLGAGASLGNNCDDQQQATKEAFGRLVARQVIIFVATGNNGLPSQVSSPACISNSTAVGATYDVESPTGGRWCPQQKDVTPLTIACFTNRGRAMDLLAPGLFIVTSGMGGGVTEPGAGTSYASPMAAGVAALMLQADPDLRPSEIERIMQRTGTDVKHLENDDIFSLVNARRAVEEVLPETPMPSETPEPSATPTREATNEPSDTPTPEPGTPATSPTAAERTPTSTRTAAPTRTRTVNDDYDLFLPALKNLAR